MRAAGLVDTLNTSGLDGSVSFATYGVIDEPGGTAYIRLDLADGDQPRLPPLGRARWIRDAIRGRRDQRSRRAPEPGKH